tara:strand:- start:1516 stop:2376 length:861 start_codon:yes stop_codon:yes gene_type:complete
MKIIPRRSVLYVPGVNSKALKKAEQLPCDGLIFDLEDAIAPESKKIARKIILEAISDSRYGYREIVVRLNPFDTEWGREELPVFARSNADALLFPKIESIGQVEEILFQLDAAGGSHMPIWLMVETPRAVLDIDRIASSSDRIACLVMGTSDLVNELRGRHVETRQNISYSLQRTILVARSNRIGILDGVHLDFKDQDSFRIICESARDMGFDGKTLIHPLQVDAANEVFGVSPQDFEQAQQLLSVWKKAQASGKGVAVVDGRLVENLHIEEAKRIVEMQRLLESR